MIKRQKQISLMFRKKFSIICDDFTICALLCSWSFCSNLNKKKILIYIFVVHQIKSNDETSFRDSYNAFKFNLNFNISIATYQIFSYTKNFFSIYRNKQNFNKINNSFIFIVINFFRIRVIQRMLIKFSSIERTIYALNEWFKCKTYKKRCLLYNDKK